MIRRQIQSFTKQLLGRLLQVGHIPSSEASLQAYNIAISMEMAMDAGAVAAQTKAQKIIFRALAPFGRRFRLSK